MRHKLTRQEILNEINKQLDRQLQQANDEAQIAIRHEIQVLLDTIPTPCLYTMKRIILLTLKLRT